jgi:transcriptional regulator
MYTPKYSRVDDPATALELMRRYNFAQLVTHTAASGLVVTHVPVVVRDLGTLQLHVARANPQWRGVTEGEVLVVFAGPHAYVSPAWYEDRAEVPTWNYAAVHAYGTARYLGEAELAVHLRELVETSEAANGTDYVLDQAPPGYVAGLSRGVVGIEIAVTRLEGKLKMNQNRSAADRKGVVAALRARGAMEVAEWVERCSELTGSSAMADDETVPE